jgi:hypothetical protein
MPGRANGGEIFGELDLVTRRHAEPPPPRTGPRLVARDPPADIVGEIVFRQFAVIDDIDAATLLTAHGLGHRLSEAPVERGRVVGLARRFGDDHRAQIHGPRQ